MIWYTFAKCLPNHVTFEGEGERYNHITSELLHLTYSNSKLIRRQWSHCSEGTVFRSTRPRVPRTRSYSQAQIYQTPARVWSICTGFSFKNVANDNFLDICTYYANGVLMTFHQSSVRWQTKSLDDNPSQLINQRPRVLILSFLFLLQSRVATLCCTQAMWS